MKTKSYRLLMILPMLLAGCAGSPIVDQQFNSKAAIPADFNFTKQGFKVVCTLINKNKATMSTLYGNDIALTAAKTGSQQHTPGLVMALITWKQQANPYWYGDNIPGLLLSVETITADSKTNEIKYSFFSGNKLVYQANPANAEIRKRYILSQKPSIMP